MPEWETEAIYRIALQEIVDADPAALDAQRVAAKALGDATEFCNTGTVRWRNPLPAPVHREEGKGNA